jgi:hypothetical protein
MLALILALAVGDGGMVGADAASAASTRTQSTQLEARAALVPLAAVMVCIRVCPAAGAAAAKIVRRTPKQIRHLPAPKPVYAKAFSDAAGGSSASRALRRALLRQNPTVAARYMRQGYHAHHIVSHSHPRAELARMVLQMRGIRANDAANGVWLRPAVHASSHSYAYYANVNAVVGKYHFNSFRPTSELVRDLQRIGELLQKGQLPL